MFAAAILALAGGPACAAPPPPELPAGWGIDAPLLNLPAPEFAAYLNLLKASGVRVVRERSIGFDGDQPDRSVADRLRALHSAGLKVAAFAALPHPVPVSRPEDALPEDLLAVFAQGQILGRDLAGLVDAWEEVGEPDVGYCRDLPDRVVAFQKALYLGIKAGAAERGGSPPAVLAGAFALPPGRWAERAARNGLFDYTDAGNFHYYGRAEDFAGTIAAFRRLIGRPLPLWVTECGAKTVAPGDFLNPGRRRLQSDFVAATARTARDSGLSVFMPFILNDGNDPYALTLAPDRPLPAWTAYAELTQALRFPVKPSASDATRSTPVVLQWLPAPGTAHHKVSGSYRFGEASSPQRASAAPAIQGELKIYNFSASPQSGQLTLSGGPPRSTSFPARRQLTLAPRSVTTLRGEFTRPPGGYSLTTWRVSFHGPRGEISPLEFNLETAPVEPDFTAAPLQWEAAASPPHFHAMHPDYRIASSAGPWTGLNGVRVIPDPHGGYIFQNLERTGDPDGDPLFPPGAVAAIAGLPADGFLRVTSAPLLPAGSGVRVDLVDDQGVRYAVWENFGQDYERPSPEIWLNARDFSVYFWGPCPAVPRFRPEKIREVQLRFYPPKLGAVVRLGFDWMTARR